MIVLHRLGHDAESFQLNPDLIVTVEETPDTVITLTTGVKIVVLEPADRVADRIRACRVALLSEAMRHRREERTLGSAIASRQATRGVLSAVENIAVSAVSELPGALQAS